MIWREIPGLFVKKVGFNVFLDKYKWSFLMRNIFLLLIYLIWNEIFVYDAIYI